LFFPVGFLVVWDEGKITKFGTYNSFKDEEFLSQENLEKEQQSVFSIAG